MTGKKLRAVSWIARPHFSWLELICIGVAAQLFANGEWFGAFSVLVLGAVLNAGIEHYTRTPPEQAQ